MTTVVLYKYTRDDGGITVSPVKPDREYSVMYRLIADEGKTLTRDNVSFAPCVDVESKENWIEIVEE